MTPASPSLISKLKQSKKWLFLALAVVLVALVSYFAFFDLSKINNAVHPQTELNATMQKNAQLDQNSLVNLGGNENLASKEEEQVLSQADDPTVAYDVCMASSIKFSFPFIYITTFGNLKQESCDSHAFYSMNLASLKAQLEAVDKPTHVSRLGPLNFAMTKNLSYSEHPYIYIGVQKFTEVSKIRMGFRDLIKNPELFYERDITKAIAFYPLHTQESISLYWAPNESAHALVDPNGTVYMLTTFNTRLLPQLNRHNLSIIRELITLPKGWHFVTEKITKPIYINHRSEGGFTNIRLIDNLGNIYIKLIQEQ